VNYNVPVVWLKFVGEWTWADYDLANEDVCVLLGDREWPTSLVFNLLCGPNMPLDHVFSHLQRTLQSLPRDIELLLVIGANASAKGLPYVFSRTNVKWNPVFVDSIEEASDFILGWQQRRRWSGTG